MTDPLPSPKTGGFHDAGFRTKTCLCGSGSKLSVAKPQSAAREWVNARREGLAGWKRTERFVELTDAARECRVDS